MLHPVPLSLEAPPQAARLTLKKQQKARTGPPSTQKDVKNDSRSNDVYENKGHHDKMSMIQSGNYHNLRPIVRAIAVLRWTMCRKVRVRTASADDSRFKIHNSGPAQTPGFPEAHSRLRRGRNQSEPCGVARASCRCLASIPPTSLRRPIVSRAVVRYCPNRSRSAGFQPAPEPPR